MRHSLSHEKVIHEQAPDFYKPMELWLESGAISDLPDPSDYPLEELAAAIIFHLKTQPTSAVLSRILDAISHLLDD